MLKDYPIYHNNFGCVGIGQSWGFQREQDFSYPCSCHQHHRHFPSPPHPPFPPMPPFSPEPVLRLYKLDARTNAPLAGAVFELTRDGQVIDSTASPATGEIAFASLAPGKYILRESAAPPNYRLDTTPHEVDVYPNGMVTLDGGFSGCGTVLNYPMNRSLPPQMNPITVASTSAGGTGTTGCQINVTWPNGEVTSTGVNNGGTWAVSKPEGLVLVPGYIVRANQVCSQHLPSEDVYVGVTV